MKSFLLFLFGAGALWDVATTVYGTWVFIENESVFGILASIAFGLVILAIISSTLWIWKKSDLSGMIFKTMWFFALIYDLITSWKGNNELLFTQSVEGFQFLLLIGITVYMTASPIMWVYVNNESEYTFK